MGSSHLYRSVQIAVSVLFLSLAVGCGDGSNGGKEDFCNSLKDCPEGQRCTQAGTCSSEEKTCESLNDCAFDEYCADSTCAPAACAQNEDCVDSAYCDISDGGDTGKCAIGCRDDDDCGSGEECSDTHLCESVGCSTGTCAQFQQCNQNADPPTCEYTGDCGGSNPNAICVAYSQQVDDGEEYFCETASQSCEPKPPCNADTDCQRDGDICEPRPSDGKKVCRSGCRDDEDCGLGQICATEQGFVCVSGCGSDDDCNSEGDPQKYACEDLICIPVCETRNDCPVQGQVCSGQPATCHGCESDAECPATEECDLTEGEDPDTGLCVPLPPECPDDGYGDNHAPEDGYGVSSFPFAPTDPDRPLFCQENQGGEWFEIQASAGDVIELSLAYDNSKGNLDIGLFRSDGTQIVASEDPPTTDEGDELVRYGVDLGATFLVQVRGTIVEPNINYDISIDVRAPDACMGDSLEPNSDTSPATIDEGVDYTDLEVCGDAADYYFVDVAANQVVSMTAESPVNLGNIDLLVKEWDETNMIPGTVVASSQTSMDVESLEFSTTDADKFVVEVRISSGVGRTTYDLRWTQRDNVCTDQFEQNDTCQTAKTLTDGTYDMLNICADQDYYAIDLLPLQTVTITATYDTAVGQGDLDINLFGPDNCTTLVAAETTTQDPNSTVVTETVTFQAQQGGTYYLQGGLFSGINVPYSLDVDITDGPPCQNDSLANDTSGTAHTISRADALNQQDNIETGLRICDAEEDWFQMDLQDGDTIEWQVEFNNADGNIDAYLYGPGPGATPLDSGTSDTDNESVTYTVGTGEAGTYYLQVVGANPTRNDYWLLTYINGTGPVDPDCPDDYENNDQASEAKPIADGSYGLLVCGNPRDDDWFEVPLVAGEVLDVDVSFTHANGNIDLVLYDDSGSTVLAQSTTSNDVESVTYNSARDQTVLVQIRTTSTASALPYDLDITTTPAPPCIADEFDPNGDAGSAATVTAPGLYGALMKCEDDEDWFSVDLTGGEDFEAFLNFDGDRGDLDVYLYDPADTTTALASAESTDDDESLTYTPGTTGTYLIQVKSKTGERVRLPYDLLLYHGDADGDGVLDGPEDRECPDDFEQNDTRSTAAPVPVGIFDDLLLCWSGTIGGNDRDYYSVFVPANAEVTARISFDHSLGDLQARLYQGSSSTAVDTSTSDTNDEEVTHTNGGQGTTYYIEVFGGESGINNYYALEVSLMFANACSDDSIGAVDETQATVTTSGGYEGLTLCESTEDWFEMPAGSSSIEAHIELANKLGDIDVQLLDSALNVVAESANSTNFETIDETGLSTTETYYLRVYPKGGAFIRNDYDLWLSVDGTDPGVPYCPDEYERNDTLEIAGAIDISDVGQFTGMNACGPDVDYYSLGSLFSSQTYDVHVFFDHAAQSDLTVEILDDTGTAIDVTDASGSTTQLVDSADNDEMLSFGPASTGEHFAVITNKGNAETPYDLFGGRQNATCPEDTANEPNDDDFNTAPLSLPFHGGMALCGDNDYFEVTPMTSDPVTVTARYDGSGLNFGLKVFRTFDLGTVGVDNSDSGNRRTVTFDPDVGDACTDGADCHSAVCDAGACAPATYGIGLLRKKVDPADTDLSNGPYFLHVTQ